MDANRVINKDLNKSKQAFTLIELSVVLIIVATILSGIIYGDGLVYSARVANSKAITGKSVVREMEGLVAWYEASLKDSINEQAKDAQITEWRDMNPSSIASRRNSLTKTASAGMIRKYSGIKEMGSMSFNGSDRISLTSFQQGSTAQVTAFLVFRPLVAPTATARIILDSHSSGLTSSIGIKNNAVSLNAGFAVDTATGSSPASFLVDQDYILAVYFNGASSSSAYVNNATILAGASNVSNPGSNQLSGLTIGSDRSGSNGFNGWISEVIIFNRPLKLQERKDVMSYLSNKYQISVSGI